MANRFLNNIKINDQYTLPSTDGSADQVIKTDGSGNLSFVDLSSIEGAQSNFVYFEVKNETGSTINKGKGVMAVGTDGNSGHILIDEMVADGSVEAKYFLGVLEDTLTNGSIGKVISFGELYQFNTNGQNGETWADGQVLWCDPANNGDFTITEPDGPNVKIAAAFILNKATNGKIQVRVQANEGIHDLHDTKITSQVDGDVLVWDNTTGVWFNDSTLNIDYTNSKVGIGTISPIGKLDVSDGTNPLTIDSSTYNEIQSYNRPLLLNRQGNNVGIGTTSTTNGKLVIDSTTNQIAIETGTAGDGRLNIGHFSNGTFIGTYGDDGGAADLIRFGTHSGDERMRITSAGNVGIGTTSPGAKLDVTGEGNFSSYLNVNSSAGIRSSGWVHLQRYQSNLHVSVGNNGSNVNFYVPNGNVGIGTTDPSAKLDIVGGGQSTSPTLELNTSTSSTFNHAINAFNSNLTTGENQIIVFGKQGSTKNSGYIGYKWIGDNSNDNLVTIGHWASDNLVNIDALGNVGIGTTSPEEKLDVNGNIKASSFIKDGGTSNQFLKADGSVDTTVYVSKEDSDSIFTSKTLSQNISFGESYASNYRSRVLDYGGTFFPRPLGYEIGLMKEQELFQKAKLSLLPSGVGIGNIHNLKPKNDTFNFTRNSTATYVNEDGLIAVAPINTPRLNYPMIDGVVSGCPSLLLEPERRNLIHYSEDFDNGFWVKVNSSVVGGQLSPKGDLSAFKLVEDSTTNIHYIVSGQMNIANTTPYSMSCIVKANGRNWVRITSWSGHSVFYDLTNATTGTVTGGATGTIKALPNGFYRLTMNYTSAATVEKFFIYLADADNSTTYTGDGTSGLYIFGAQLEQGSYPTSYIPNFGTALGVTRVAETCNGAGDVNTFNDSEGVLMVEASTLENGVTEKVISLSDGTTNNVVYISWNALAEIAFVVFSGGNLQFIKSITLDQTENNKLAINWELNNVSCYVNGIELLNNDTSVLTPINLSVLALSYPVSAVPFYGNTKQIQYFDKVLTDTELEELTSWTSFREMATSQLYTIE